MGLSRRTYHGQSVPTAPEVYPDTGRLPSPGRVTPAVRPAPCDLSSSPSPSPTASSSSGASEQHAQSSLSSATGQPQHQHLASESSSTPQSIPPNTSTLSSVSTSASSRTENSSQASSTPATFSDSAVQQDALANASCQGRSGAPAPKVRRRGRPPKTATLSRGYSHRVAPSHPLWRSSGPVIATGAHSAPKQESTPSHVSDDGSNPNLTSTSAHVAAQASPANLVPPPMVFQCHRCLTIIGDSTAWLTAQRQLGLIVLRDVTDKVVTLEFLTMTDDSNWECYKFAPLACAKCDQVLGRLYRDTPPDWSIMRGAYCLYHSTLVVYQLGSVCSSRNGADVDFGSISNAPHQQQRPQQQPPAAPSLHSYPHTHTTSPTAASPLAMSPTKSPPIPIPIAPQATHARPVSPLSGATAARHVPPMPNLSAAAADLVAHDAPSSARSAETDLEKIRTLLMVMGERLMHVEQQIPALQAAANTQGSAGGASAGSMPAPRSGTGSAVSPSSATTSMLPAMEERVARRGLHPAWADERRSTVPASSLSMPTRRNVSYYFDDHQRRWPSLSSPLFSPDETRSVGTDAPAHRTPTSFR